MDYHGLMWHYKYAEKNKKKIEAEIAAAKAGSK
jgi:hypothetical protein